MGRNIAESHTATVSYAVTFTYGRDWDGRADHLRSVLLTYHDIQKMLMRMRKVHGYRVRFIICGEYGTALGRAHWHGVFHFYADGWVKNKAGVLEYRRYNLPDWEGEHLNWDQERWDRVGGIHIPEWVDYDDDKTAKPMGHVHIKKATYAHVKYALKYLLKDVGDDKSQWKLAMSKAPPLGHEYFVQLATESVAAGLVPQDAKYSFPVRNMSGQEIRQTFMLRRKMAEVYLQTVIDQWELQHPGRQRPSSEVVDTFEQWGRLGKEENLTQAWVDNLPGDESIFGADGQLLAGYQARLDEPRPMGEPLKPRAIRDRIDWISTYIQETSENGALTRQEQQQLRAEVWADAERDAQQSCPIPAAGVGQLTANEYRYWINHPTRFAAVHTRALIEARRARNAEGE